MAESKSLQAALLGLQGIAESFTDPDDDFASVIFLESQQGEAALVPAYQYMENDTTKQLFFEAIMPELIKKVQAARCVMVLSAWVLMNASPEYFTNDEPRPADHPDRVEVVTVIEMTPDGIETSKYAYINRDPLGVAVPTLSEFHDYPEGASQGGRSVDGILQALKEANQ